MPAAEANLITDMLMSHYADSDSSSLDSDSSITLDLTVDVGPYGGDRVVRRGVTIGASDFGSSVADLTAEVDFEVGPDVSGEQKSTCLRASQTTCRVYANLKIRLDFEVNGVLDSVGHAYVCISIVYCAICARPCVFIVPIA